MNSKLYCINPNTKEYEEVKTICGINIEEILDLIKDYKMSKDLKFDKFEKLEEIKRLKEEYVMLQNASDEVEEELQQRIDKAIEYIKFNATSNYFDAEKNMFRREIDLLEILGGSDKE